MDCHKRIGLLLVCLLATAHAAGARASESVRILKAPGGTVCAVAYSPDGATVAGLVQSESVSVCLWDARTGELKGQMHREGHLPTLGLAFVAFSPDGRLLASAGDSVALWEVATGRVRWEVALKPRRIRCHWLAFSPDGRSVLGAMDEVREWDVAEGRVVRSWPLRVPEYSSWALSPDGRTLAAGRFRGGLELWGRDSGQKVRELIPKPPGGTDRTESYYLAFSPDGRLLASLRHRRPSPIRLWDVASGRERRPIPRAEGGFAHFLCFCPAGRLLACHGGREDEIRIYEAVSGQERCRLKRRAFAAAFSPGGAELALTQSSDLPGRSEVAVWEFYRPGAGEAASPPAAAELDRLWEALASPDGRAAHRAITTLIAHPGPAVGVLRERLRPVRPVGAGRLAELIGELGDPRFQVRERATRELIELGPPAEPLLREALKGQSDAEFRRRAEAVLGRLYVVPAERLRALRAVEVLERIGTAEARDVLRRLAGEEAEAQAARAALSRMKARD